MKKINEQAIRSKRKYKKNVTMSKAVDKRKKSKKRPSNVKSKKRRLWSFLHDKNTIYLLLFLLTVIVFQTNFFAHRVDGVSMQPTFLNNDLVLLRKTRKIQRYEIVTFRPEEDRSSSYIKRVIGVPGDYIWVDGNTLFLAYKDNTQQFVETPKRIENMSDGMIKINVSDEAAKELAQYDQIPKGCYFVQGDNRNNSNDSRNFGLVKDEQIEGTLFLRYFPINKFGVPK
ncbi:signal peptidase I [Enterococcus sp. DIV0242_7C1]|uniref:Signal peptidase I n=1 Tax=Candidatus Enterococcus dunnyi TaxID=1834192 RepID=A0A200J008_9ENTE|nr:MULTISPECIES: signal peptidase I [unclassified Enterococcus]MBO0470113.1 signal peptidase I [Enterococcus sp. DIV0242_7C1]OUZ30566.1 signal peptidase I [Enterococcus sp. 9D6_DIV0238]